MSASVMQSFQLAPLPKQGSCQCQRPANLHIHSQLTTEALSSALDGEELPSPTSPTRGPTTDEVLRASKPTLSAEAIRIKGSAAELRFGSMLVSLATRCTSPPLSFSTSCDVGTVTTFGEASSNHFFAFLESYRCLQHSL